MTRVLLLIALLAVVSFEVRAEEATPEPAADAASEAGVAPATSSANPTATGEPEHDASGPEEAAPMLEEVVVTDRADEEPAAGTRLDDAALATPRAAATDSARLLQDVPGVTLGGAGGISSLPVIHGLADDRVRVQVDGMDVTSACPNHMNSPLSYISPKQVSTATVVSGITPVSAGGNSLGGTIQMDGARPDFAEDEKQLLASGHAGTFYRSNGKGFGYDFGAGVAARDVALSYDESTARSRNYRAGKSFRPSGPAAPLRGWLDGDEVGSTAFDGVTNRDVALALRRDDHLLRLNLGQQRVGFEGFPNQRMDLTSNQNTLVNLRWEGRFDWGELDARAFAQHTEHEMDMGPDRFFFGFGMPMSSKSTNRGARLHGSVPLGDRDLLRVGAEYFSYRLDDWWSPAGASGSMCCRDFRNVHDGEQDRVGLYAEWEARWSPQWLTLLGLRGDFVTSDAGRVHGYNETMGIWTADAAAFNALDRRRKDFHLDLVALARFEPHELVTLEGGYARKTRSPNLYERYTWSTNSMAALMNNLVGDGNGYVGDVGLKPEVAHTASGTLDLHDAAGSRWSVRTTAYLTHVEDYVDARRCGIGQCSAANLGATESFVFLQYANQPARLHGVDLEARWKLGTLDPVGSFTLNGTLAWVRGKNRKTKDGLYRVMPLHGMLALVHERGGWTNRIELRGVAEKHHLSDVRNEIPTARYSLLDLRTSWQMQRLRIDLSLENVFDRDYDLPLGGAYVGQGLTMSSLTTPWGIAVPGPGRSLNLALSVEL